MPVSRNGHVYRPNPPRRLVGPPSWLAPDPLAGSGEPIPATPVASTPDQSAGPDKMVSPWVVAVRAMGACAHHRRPACGCNAGECVRPDKAGPTDVVRCAACLGLALPTSA